MSEKPLNDLYRKALNLDESIKKLIESEAAKDRELTKTKGQLLRARQSLRDVGEKIREAKEESDLGEMLIALNGALQMVYEELTGHSTHHVYYDETEGPQESF